MENYKIQIVLDAFSIELSSHDKDWVEKKIKEYELEKIIKNVPSKKPERKESNEQADNVLNLSSAISTNEFFRSYIKGKKISSRPDLATFFVYYLSKVKKMDLITTSDVKNCFKEISFPNWNKINISDALYQAKKRAFLNNIDDQWMLSITGEDYVLNKISG
jgi:hypothetical protein